MFNKKINYKKYLEDKVQSKSQILTKNKKFQIIRY